MRLAHETKTAHSRRNPGGASIRTILARVTHERFCCGRRSSALAREASFVFRPTKRAYGVCTNKESPVFAAHAIGHKPYALLVPAQAQVCFVKTDRKSIGGGIGTSAIVCYTEVIYSRNV